MRKLFLDEKENSCACLLGFTARQEKEAQLVRSQLGLYKESNSEESAGVNDMETRLNMAENALHDLRSERNATVEKIAAERKGIGANDNDDLMQPTHTKAKYAKVERLGNVLNFLQGQLQSAADMEKTTVQVSRKEKETAALIDLRLKVLWGKKQYMQEKANACACLQEMLVAVKEDEELLRSRLGALKDNKSGIQEMEAK
jgi:hypothetical protein